MLVLLASTYPKAQDGAKPTLRHKKSFLVYESFGIVAIDGLDAKESAASAIKE
jgi:hypothetical protein